MNDKEIRLAVAGIMSLRPSNQSDMAQKRSQKKMLAIKKRRDDYLFKKELSEIEAGRDIRPLSLVVPYFGEYKS